jgi:hypothetical protein
MAPSDDNFDVLLIWWIENEAQCLNQMAENTPSLADGAVYMNVHAQFGKFNYLKERIFHKLVYRSEDRRDLMNYWSVHKRTLMGLFPWLPDLDTGKVTGSGPDSSTLGTVESVSPY